MQSEERSRESWGSTVTVVLVPAIFGVTNGRQVGSALLANAYAARGHFPVVFQQDRRGANETIGFVLVFSLIVLTVGVVLTAGYSGLQDARDAERVNNAERAFDVLADNIEDITHREAPSRGTEIRLAEASIGSGPPTHINISGFKNGSRVFTTGNYSTDSVVYRAEDTRIRYAGGAVTRIQGGGSTLLDPPGFVISQNHTIIPTVKLLVEDRTVAGAQTVLIRTDRSIREVEISENGGVDTLQFNVSTPAPDAWNGYLEGQGMSCTRTDQGSDRAKLSCTLEGVERVKTVWFLIEITFE